MIYETDNVRATLHPEMEDYDQQRMTELQQREYFNEYGSFADNKGSLMIDPRFTGQGINEYSPENMPRESLYNRKTNAKENGGIDV